MTVADFINEMAVKAGVKSDDEALKGILSANDLNKIEMPETLFNSIDTSLLSLESAKNNHPTLKSVYFSQALDGLDKELEKMKDEYNIPDEVYEEIKKERSSFKKVNILTGKIKELESKKAGASTKEDKTAYQKQIDELTKTLQDKEKALADAQKDYDNKLSSFKKNIKLESAIAGYKTIYDDLPAEIKALTIKNILSKELQDNDADFLLDEKESLDLLKKDGTAYLGPNHQRITPQSFIDSVLAKNKILKTTEAPPASNGGSQTPSNTVAATQNGSGVKNLVQEQLANLERNNAVTV
jgi:flagellar biosynthesis chaperone FliJ